MHRHKKFWSESLKGNDDLEDLGAYEGIILRFILNKSERNV
jgi:hypothetical protein